MVSRAAVLLTLAAFAAPSLLTTDAEAKSAINDIEIVKREAEHKIRNLLEPLFDKYCRDECKLMSVNVTADLSTPDELSPGFDDIDPRSASTIAPSTARIRILMDDKVGEVSRGKLLELVQQYLDTLDFPVKIETQTSHFPQPVASAAKVIELRDRVSKQFKNTIDELFRQFCPEQCLLADYDLQTDVVNPEEAQYGTAGEFAQDGGIAIRIRGVNAALLIDESLPTEVRNNIVEMARLKTNYMKNVNLAAKTLQFPKPASTLAAEGKMGAVRGLASLNSATNELKSISDTKNTESKVSTNTNSNTASNSASNNNATTSNENNSRQERFERIEKIERVESGDAVQAELAKFKVYGLVFACSIISLLIFISMASLRSGKSGGGGSVHRVIQSMVADPASVNAPSTYKAAGSEMPTTNDERMQLVAKRYDIERLKDELTSAFAQNPKVAKAVFTRVLTEEGVETTAEYIHLFGESIVVDMIRDPSLQSDINELMDYYAKNTIDLNDDETLELLRKLHNRTVAGKLAVMGSRSSHLFDYLADMDGMQILELIRNESLTVKSIVLTQCDAQKRGAIYAQMDEESRMQLLAELSRIDYLPRDYIFNVANALKRKRRDNPKLNTEALPGSEVLLTLLERTGPDMQKTVIRNLELSNPDSARVVKSKLVSLDTLRHLRDGQLLEVVLSLRHDELLQFLKGAPNETRTAIFSKSPKDLVAELEEELANVSALSRESYQAVERKVINRMKIMANEGLVNLIETNDRMLAEVPAGSAFVEAGPVTEGVTNIKKVAGW